jgi:hypothetical protein
MGWVSLPEHGREVVANGSDFLIPNVHIEDFSQDLKLLSSGELLIIEELLV